MGYDDFTKQLPERNKASPSTKPIDFIEEDSWLVQPCRFNQNIKTPCDFSPTLVVYGAKKENHRLSDFYVKIPASCRLFPSFVVPAFGHGGNLGAEGQRGSGFCQEAEE